MYRQLETYRAKPTPEEPVPAGVCNCACSEPVPSDGGDVPAGNRSVVQVQEYWDING